MEISNGTTRRALRTVVRSAARDRSCYLPRDVFFARLGFASAFFTFWVVDFGRFLPATSDSFPIGVLPSAPYRASPRCAAGSFPPCPGLPEPPNAELLEGRGRNALGSRQS